MTEASVRALEHLRDFSTLKRHVIPLLAIVLSIYAVPVLMNVVGMGILGWIY
jgi:hypothetical protein